MYIEGILGRINLTDTISEDGFKVLDGTIGEWLEHHKSLFLNYFVSTASNGYLDLLGKEYGLLRLDDESDDDFRKRLLIEINIIQSSTDIIGAGVTLWIYDENVLNGEEYLTSKNPILKDTLHSPIFLAHADSFIQEYITSKFLFEEDLEWF